MTGMDSPWWPLTALRLRTPALELRFPTAADLSALAALAFAGVHDPAVQPFAVAWTDTGPAERARSVLQYHWRTWGAWTADAWRLDFAVLHDGQVVGSQGVSGQDFAIRREVSTGSWLGQAYQAKGIGTEMRAAVLHLAFEGLGAQQACSSAFTDNQASLGVSRKLGYAADGIERFVIRGRPVISQRLRLDRASWQAAHRVPVTVDGLEPCLPMFGLPASSPVSGRDQATPCRAR
jgi:RimJ/RimL family protein N-acetyltransferase